MQGTKRLWFNLVNTFTDLIRLVKSDDKRDILVSNPISSLVPYSVLNYLIGDKK